MIAVVIPCYRVKSQILDVLSGIGPECQAIYVIDDGCPEATGGRASPRNSVSSLCAHGSATRY